MFRMFPIVTALFAVAASGTAHGLWTDRWKWSDEPDASAAKMSRVALQLDDWEGEELEAKSSKMPGVAGTLYRRYVNRRDGRAVSVFIICGRPGAISIHTPPDCYGASGFEVLSQERCQGPADLGAELYTAQFRKTQAADQTNLRIFWSWNATGAWQAPDYPRLAFARRPALYKMYVIREMTGGDEPIEKDPSFDLMKQLLPELQRGLFGPT